MKHPWIVRAPRGYFVPEKIPAVAVVNNPIFPTPVWLRGGEETGTTDERGRSKGKAPSAQEKADSAEWELRWYAAVDEWPKDGNRE